MQTHIRDVEYIYIYRPNEIYASKTTIGQNKWSEEIEEIG